MKHSTRKIAVSAMLIALALALSVAERLLPIGALIPVYGIKLGLANVVTMMALFYIGAVGALVILVSRCMLASLFSGVMSLLFSLTGGLLALAVMLLLVAGYNRAFSLFGISVGGAAAHNVGQILAASALLGENLIYTYLPVLLFAAIATGVLTASVAGVLFAKLEKNGVISRYFPDARMMITGERT